VFVGRERELALLLESAGRAPAAGLVVVLVSGEPGIGKSALLSAAAAGLAGGGWRVLAAEADPRIPYATVATAIGSPGPPIGDSFTEGLRRDALAALELADTDPTIPAGAWFGRACKAVTSLLTALAAHGPVAIAIDDLHQLDDDSLALLAVTLHRVGTAPIALLAAMRSHLAEPNAGLAELLAELAETADYVPVELTALPPPELAAIIEPVLGAPPDADLLDEVCRRADGNPFFATEIARSLADHQLVAVDRERARLTVSPGVVRLTRRTAVLRRVAPLTPETRAVARTVSVFRRIRLDQIGLLARVAGLAEPLAAAAFDDLLTANVLTEDARHGYRFSHDLVADALYDEIGPAERRRLHRLIADRLGADRALGLDVDLLELAWHVSESAEPGDGAAVELLTEAARRARTRAPETAAALCGRALELAPANAQLRADLLSLRCRTLARASRAGAAIDPGLAALALLPPGRDRSRTATAVISSLFSVGRLPEAIELAEAEIATGAAPATLHAQHAMLLVFANRNDEALAQAARTEWLPMESAAEQVVVYGQLAMLTSMLARHDRTVEFADRALRSAGQSPVLARQALAVGASTGALSGLVADATERLHQADRLREISGDAFRAEILVAGIALAWLTGRWDAALEGLPRASAELDAHEQAALASALVAIELEIRSWRGELDLAARLLRRPPPLLRNMTNLHALALSGYLMARGESDQARRTIESAIDDPAYAAYSCLLLGRLVELELDCGRTSAADRVLSTLVEVATSRVSPWSTTTLHRAIGLVRGDAVALRRAVSAADGGGLGFEKARAQLALGLIDPTAVDDLVEAYLTVQRLGVHRLRREAGQRLRQLGAKVPRARARTPGLLTEAEERIARLVQQGMRNRDIAAALHYSPRSIEVYLSRIYAKLRISSRLELARALDALQTSQHPPRS